MINYKSAYRRCHLSARTALQTCTQPPDENLAIVALRLTFGGAPGPYEWGAISETICDLSVAISHSDDWDPEALRAPNGDMVPPPKSLSNDEPFAEGKELVVDMPLDTSRTTGVYIDDTIALGVDVKGANNVDRLMQVTLLAIHCAAREKHPDEPIPRD